MLTAWSDGESRPQILLNCTSYDSFFCSILLKPLTHLLFKTAKSGAQTTLFAALDPDLDQVSGLYFSDCNPKEVSEAARDDKSAKRLWEITEIWTNIQKLDWFSRSFRHQSKEFISYTSDYKRMFFFQLIKHNRLPYYNYNLISIVISMLIKAHLFINIFLFCTICSHVTVGLEGIPFKGLPKTEKDSLGTENEQWNRAKKTRDRQRLYC